MPKNNRSYLGTVPGFVVGAALAAKNEAKAAPTTNPGIRSQVRAVVPYYDKFFN